MKWNWIFMLLLTQFVNAQDVRYEGSNGIIHFVSSAPLEKIEATSEILRGIIDPKTNKFGFSVDIKSFEGFNSPLQRDHFNENYLESDKFPVATFAGKIIEHIDFKKAGNYTVRTKGKLKIHGIENERIIKSELYIVNDQLHIVCKFTLLLEDYQINVPRIVNHKISKEIEVVVNAKLSLSSL